MRCSWQTAVNSNLIMGVAECNTGNLALIPVIGKPSASPIVDVGYHAAMKPVTIISGCPGSGKTSLAQALADVSGRGVHLETDLFYRFLAHPLNPSKPESKAQNTTVVKAFLAATAAFAVDDYEVFVDGVIEPWWLPQIQDQLAPVHYVLLHADPDTVLARTAARTTQPSADSTVVRTMHSQFEVISGFDSHWINSAKRTPAEVLSVFNERLASGCFAVH